MLRHRDVLIKRSGRIRVGGVIQTEIIQADVSDDLLKVQLIEHIQTRFTHHRPACVWSVTFIAYLKQYFPAISDRTPTLSIVIIGYVQTKLSRKFSVTSWMSPAAWDQVSCGLYSNGDFLSYMDRANNPSMPGWCMLPIFGEVGLNNDGRLAAKRDCKVTYLSRFICRATLSFLTVCNWRFPYSVRTKPPEPEKDLKDLRGKRSDNNLRPPNRINILDLALRGPCRAISFYHRIEGFLCWIIHELCIHALGGVGAAHFPATAPCGQKRKFGDRLPCLQSRPQVAHRRL
jgi:hypothetical protein